MSKHKLSFSLLVLCLILIPSVYAQEYTPTALEITVYSEGSVKIVYDVDSDPSEARVTVGLFGPPFNNVAIRDEENNPLSYTTDGSNVTVNSLGALELNIQYLTSVLTSKDGALWTLNITLPVAARIILPLGAAVVDLNQIPTNIGTLESKQFMDFGTGDLSLYYIIGLPSIVGESETAIEDATSYIDSKTTQDYVLTDAEALLQSAESAYQSEDYVLAKSNAAGALSVAQATVSDADDAAQAITKAETAVGSAEEQGRTEGLELANQSYDSAVSSYDDGEYVLAETQANTAVLLAQNAFAPPSGGNSMLYIGLGILVIAGAGAGGSLYMQNKGKDDISPSFSNQKIIIDIDKLLGEHKDLRMEDREVLKFIAESNGEAFASEIRERFDLPRSSAWRLIRRLEGLEIVEEAKIGNQSLIRISPAYHS